MAQIGEFSFIIAALGRSMGVTTEAQYPIVVAVSVLTTFTTPYLIRISHKSAVALESILPLRLKNLLSQYAAWSSERRADSASQSRFYQAGSRWLISGIVMTVIFTLIAGLAPSNVNSYVQWLVAVLLSAPFFWAMFFAFGRSEAEQKLEPRSIVLLFVSRMLTLVWFGVLTLEMLNPGMALAITGSILFLALISLRKQLSASFQWFEGHFLSTFETTAKTKRPTDVFRHLAPWDAHLVRFKVHPNSEVAGLRLEQTNLRGRFGLNVVVIQRGLRTIVAPQPDEQLYPKDELLVLGTDDQIDAARQMIEKPPGLAERFSTLSGYQLKQCLVGATSRLRDKSIRESGIREHCGGMVVGLERGDSRIVNPNSNEIVREADVLWVVGDTDRLEALNELNG